MLLSGDIRISAKKFVVYDGFNCSCNEKAGMDLRNSVLLVICIAMIAMSGCTSTPPAPAAPPLVATLPETPAVTAPTPMNAMGCTDYTDCVPAQCCHPSSCINKVAARVCDQVCTSGCEGPLDCGAGTCGCVQGTCSVIPAKSALDSTAKPTIKIEAAPKIYSPMMSSTPGIALTVNATGLSPSTTTYTWTASYGQFLSWNPPDYTVNQLGMNAGSHGEKIYWSYTDKPATTSVPVTVFVTAKDTRTGTELGKSTLTLAWDGNTSVRVQDIS